MPVSERRSWAPLRRPSRVTNARHERTRASLPRWISGRCADRPCAARPGTMISMGTKDADEWLACATLQAALGVEVERHDVQVPQPSGSRQPRADGRHDLTIIYPDGRPPAAVEVVSTRDKRAMSFSAASPGYIASSRLTRTWVLTVSPEAGINRLKREGPACIGPT